MTDDIDTNEGVWMADLTVEQATAIFDSGICKTWTAQQIARLQLAQRLLFVPYGDFHTALAEALGRDLLNTTPALLHGWLQRELYGNGPIPTYADLIALIPVERLTELGF